MRVARVSSGTLYPILLRFEKAGLLESRWEEETPESLGRPRRRFYRLTRAGVQVAQDALGELSPRSPTPRSDAPERTIAMSQLIAVGVLLGGLVAGLLAFAPQVSEWLVRARARRLPRALCRGMEEEWLAELDAMLSRPSQLAFAIALTLTRRHSFAMDDDSLFATSSRPSVTVATIGGWPSVVIVVDAGLCGDRLRRLVSDPADVSLDGPDSGGAVANAGGIRRVDRSACRWRSASTPQRAGVEPDQTRTPSSSKRISTA